jgi:hypothetical protein
MNARPGLLLAAVLLCIYGGLALTVDFPSAAIGFQSDEATYYMMGHSLAEDGDLTYRREDLERVWHEFSTGPAGVFLKKGRDVTGMTLAARPPFFKILSEPDPNTRRRYFGKSFIYPVFAAPFVFLFGTNGFLFFHALLLALVVFCAYLFLHARAPAIPSLVLATAFVMVSVVPVYFVWITPELFNFALCFLAYFCWLYKEVAPREQSPRGTAWLFGGRSDLVAAVLIGLATFSKPSNVLLIVPIVVWQLWKRRAFRTAIASVVLVGLVGGTLFAANVAISGEWNYQGGDREAFVYEFPFQNEVPSAAQIGAPKSRDEALTNVIFDSRVFTQNLTHNLGYFFVGRYAGLLPYYFPAVFALIAFFAAPRRRPGWQWLVLAGGVAQILFFIIVTPYTWNGGGGSVGNRYFMGAYGIFLFLMPPIASLSLSFVPWVIGAVFVARMVLNPFAASFYPGRNAKSGPVRVLPVERSLVNDLPIMNEPERVRQWFGDRPGVGDPGFQIYFLDDNAYGPETDKAFWVRGESRAEFLVKTDRMMKRLHLILAPGPLDTDVTISVNGQKKHVTVTEPMEVSFDLSRGYWYETRAFVWTVSVSSSTGFVPIFNGAAGDARFLGVRVTPYLVE